jgi:rhodanese-related sulfurtransferase
MSTTISRDELKARLDRGEDFRLVEALPAEEFRNQHLPHAVNLPPDQAKRTAAQILPDKDAEIVVYCASKMCTASEDVARNLEEQGYRHVQCYVEGKKDWIEAGLPTEGQQQAVGARS